MTFRYLAAAALLILAPVAMAQQASTQEPDKKKDDTLDKAGKVAIQPVRDIGLDKDEIPPALESAVQNPYAPPAPGCRAINEGLGELNAALGDDFTVGAEQNENRTGKIAEAVGRTVINSLIPFRGLVREISGAAPAERRLQAAVTAGVARRGYLRGLASAKRCKVAPITPPPVVEKTEPKKP
ncbi:hypothetical protein WG908_03930 [Sphingobium sp. AN641]|uniref:hypothetical protein n=1 Tax=Sphingobium sp. AN641 TaxID=3133443 RepID=UPI0030C60BC3